MIKEKGELSSAPGIVTAEDFAKNNGGS